MKFVPRSEATRNFIIEASADLFNKKGYAGTSIADLEKVTHLTKGSIYGNFENKEKVALAVFDYNLERNYLKKMDMVNQCTTFKDKLLANVLVNYGLVDMGGCPLQNTAVEADDTHEELRQRAADGILRWRDHVAGLIKGGIAAGEFNKDIDAEKTALAIIAIVEGGILIGRATKDFVLFDTTMGVAKDMIKELCIL